jgi:hypothetical protein
MGVYGKGIGCNLRGKSNRRKIVMGIVKERIVFPSFCFFSVENQVFSGPGLLSE